MAIISWAKCSYFFVVSQIIFEKKIQDEDTWKIYKRAYKKYYARYMKGNMSQDAFKVWAAQAAADRDVAR